MSDRDSAVALLAAKHGFGADAVRHAADALARGTGGAAQFDHPELGGMGQWMPGMTMIGKMGDAALKARVDALFADLARSPSVTASAASPAAPPSAGAWWPAELGARPSQSGGQNGARYAYFPAANRLAVEEGGAVAVFDTTGHQITGAGQQQGTASPGSLTFQTPRGPVTLASFRRLP